MMNRPPTGEPFKRLFVAAGISDLFHRGINAVGSRTPKQRNSDITYLIGATGRETMNINYRIATMFATTLAAFLFATSAISADVVDIMSNHGVNDPVPETVLNSTDNSGTIDLTENSRRKINNLLDRVGLSGTPFVQTPLLTTTEAYWNCNPVETRGDLGVLIDLGSLYRLDAMQLYGYNVTDGGGVYTDRSPGNFTIWTASDPAAVTTASGSLLVNNISMFTQRGDSQGMSDPGSSATFGETFLFSGASQPPEVGGISRVVTDDIVYARYVFLRDITPIETDPADLNIVGLAEIQFFGTNFFVPDSFTAFRGIYVSGTLDDVLASDDSYLKYHPGFTISSTEAPVWLIFDGVYPDNGPTDLIVSLEATATTPSLTQTIEMFNWNTQQYEQVDSSDASFNNDTVFSKDVTAGITRYVDPDTGAVRSRFGWRATGLVLQYPWTISIDQVKWSWTQ